MLNNSTSKDLNSLKKILYNLPKLIGLEAGIWVGALAFLALINDPYEAHFIVCPINNLGFDFCPGCGLGNSITHIFHLEFYKSFISHPFGVFALIILITRIIKIITLNWSNYGKHITNNAFSRRRRINVYSAID